MTLYLPKITPEMIEDWRGERYLLEPDGNGGWNWTQDAADFACFLQSLPALPQNEGQK
jgi:hypothetical protein